MNDSTNFKEVKFKKIIRGVLYSLLFLCSVQASSAMAKTPQPQLSLKLGSTSEAKAYLGAPACLGSAAPCNPLNIVYEVPVTVTVSTTDTALPVTITFTDTTPSPTSLDYYVSTVVNGSGGASSGLPNTCVVSGGKSPVSCPVTFSFVHPGLGSRGVPQGQVLIIGCNTSGCADPVTLYLTTG